MQIPDEDTHDLSEHEVLQQERHEREGHAEHGQQQVAERQVQQEHVRDRAHLPVANQGQHNQRIAQDRQQEDDGIRDADPHGQAASLHVQVRATVEAGVCHNDLHVMFREAGQLRNVLTELTGVALAAVEEPLRHAGVVNTAQLWDEIRAHSVRRLMKAISDSICLQ